MHLLETAPEGRCCRDRKFFLLKDLRLQRNRPAINRRKSLHCRPFLSLRAPDVFPVGGLPDVISLPSRGSFGSRIGRWSLCGFSRSGSGTINVGNCRATADVALRDIDAICYLFSISFDLSGHVNSLVWATPLSPYSDTGPQLTAATPSGPGITPYPSMASDQAASVTPLGSANAESSTRPLNLNTYGEPSLISDEPWSWQVVPRG